MRMSASSSTIRMSCAMDLAEPRSNGGAGILARRHRYLGKYEFHRRPAAGAVVECQLAAMVFHDLLDDGKAEPRTLRAGGHIGLGQTATLGLGQAPPVIVHADCESPIGLADRQPDFA